MDPISPDSFQNDPLLIQSLPKAEALTFTGLSPKLLTRKHISTSVSLVIFLAIAVVAGYYVEGGYEDYHPLVLGLIVLSGIYSYIHNFQWQKRSGYALREKDIVYKRGFLSEKTTVVPFNRVQHVSTSRGVLDKALGLSTLLVYTAGGSGSDLSIPGLSPELAADLKEALSERMVTYV